MPSPNYIFKAKLISVCDGDTLTVRVDHGFEPILSERTFRLLGIDTPELKGPSKPYAMQAKAFLETLARSKGGDLIVQSHKPDKFGGRWLATVWLPGDDVSLNERMIRDGYARRYGGEAKTVYPLDVYPNPEAGYGR